MKLTESQLANIVMKSALRVLNESVEKPQEKTMTINEEDIKVMVTESIKQILGKIKTGFNKLATGVPGTEIGDDASIEEVAEHCGWELKGEKNGCYLFIQNSGAFGDMSNIEEPEEFMEKLQERFGEVKLIHKQCKRYEYDYHQWAIVVKIEKEEDSINESYEDDDYRDYDEPDIDMAMAMYCRDTREVYPYSKYGLNDKGKEKRALSMVGDGHIFTVGLEVDGSEYNDTSFSYDIGMDSGVHNEGHYSATSVRVNPDDVDYWGYYQNGEWVKNMDYEDESEAELTPEEIEYITKEVNEDPESYEEN